VKLKNTRRSPSAASHPGVAIGTPRSFDDRPPFAIVTPQIFESRFFLLTLCVNRRTLRIVGILSQPPFNQTYRRRFRDTTPPVFSRDTS